MAVSKFHQQPASALVSTLFGRVGIIAVQCQYESTGAGANMAEEDWNWTPEGPVGEVWSNVSGRFSAMFAHVDHKVKL